MVKRYHKKGGADDPNQKKPDHSGNTQSHSNTPTPHATTGTHTDSMSG